MRTEFIYILLFLSGLFWAMLGLAYKVADHHHCRTAIFSRMLFFSGGVCSLLVALAGYTPWHDWRLWALGVGAGILFYLVLLLLMPIYRMGPASVVWIVVNLGLLVPIFMSRLLWPAKEPLYWLDSMLLALFVLMLLAFQRGMTQASETTPSKVWLFLLMLVLLLLSNGLLLTFPKVQSVWCDQQGKNGYLAIMYFTGALFTLIVDLFKREPLRPTAWEWKAGALAGASSGIGMLLFMTAATLPAAVQYSVNGGVSLLGGVILTTVIYRERFNAMKVAGLVLGMLVLLGAVLRKPLAQRLQRLPALQAVTGQATTHYGQVPSEKPAE
ncbi:MAG: EamA family transporter [Armatimonadota bacterium]